ncbi:MAG: aminoacyl-tRNA hydrolase [Ilumatobacteraceae bacterium]|nr:aminoacyl-tRNA hydrolase [Ilumatobacteraceae bacterium]
MGSNGGECRNRSFHDVARRDTIRCVPDDSIYVTDSVRVPRSELDVTSTTSGGPGGQHANRSATRVELRLDITTTSALSAEQRQRVLNRVGAEMRVAAGDERSRTRNLAIAEQRLADRLRDALRVQRPRRTTQPTRGSKERRLNAKRRRSQTKADRRRPRHDE